ncbi:hypothetical protein [Granulicella aggregans]|uniref:hypothetical protein n=1 Tax=Granulicella aggregans TaxID=474949 RepID=UPI0021E0A057|nr:hypothetical protein [Granulicella aggregans]
MPTASSGKEPPSLSVAVPARVQSDRRRFQDDPRWALVERIAESRSLGKSPRLAEFLRYVCDRQIRGRDAEITEQRIGVKVFGRPEGYNSNEDNIVRNYARTLRKRLADYFRSEGRDEPLLILIPRGGYVPVFTPRGASQELETEFAEENDATLEEPLPLDPPAIVAEQGLPQLVDHVVPVRAPHETWRSTKALAAGLLLLVCVGIAGFLAGRGHFAGALLEGETTRANHLLWSEIFQPSRDTFVVPADGGLVMMQSFMREKVSLPDYVNGGYRSSEEIARGMKGLLKDNSPEDEAALTHKVSVLAARRYTSVVDLDLAVKLSQRAEVFPDRLVMRFARDLRIDDLRAGNAILIGSSDANPWVSLFERQLNFQFSRGNEFGGSGTILNTHPLRGEADHYASITGDPANRTYGVIAYVPNLENTGHVLIIEGVNMAGTQAAGEFLLNPDKMKPMLDRARNRQGKLQSFEILLGTTSIGSSASTSTPLSVRTQAEAGN